MVTTLTHFIPKKTRPFSLLSEGIPQGALTEISGLPGSGKTEVVLKFLSENPGLKAAWVEETFTVYPCAFPQRGVSLEHLLFIETSDYLWAVHQLLMSQVFDVVVLSASVQGEVFLRRLQIASEKSQSILILLVEASTRVGTWPLSVQIQVSRSGEGEFPQLKILKSKGRRLWSTNLVSVG